MYATFMAVPFSQKQHDDYFVCALLIAIYCKTKLYFLDGILVTYACNQTC